MARAKPAKILSGLVSVSFRSLSVNDILELVEQAGLVAIEWGGDVHVPHGEVRQAQEVARLTKDRGLQVAAYGSYYRLADSEAKGLPFERVLETAIALQAPTIRVWPGIKASAEANETYRQAVAADAWRIAELAQRAGISVSLEYHDGTLTDTNESALRLLAAVPHPNLLTLWQPPSGRDTAYALEGLQAVLPRLGNIHVFHWWPDAAHRRSLAEGAECWRQYLQVLHLTERPRFALLEFFQGDRTEQFLLDAEELRSWL